MSTQPNPTIIVTQIYPDLTKLTIPHNFDMHMLENLLPYFWEKQVKYLKSITLINFIN